jgi:hypothetical protein
MGISEVRSPWSHEGGRATGAGRPIGQSPLSTPRADRAGGHILAHAGKSPITDPKLMRRDSDLTLQTSNAKFPPGDNR